MEAGRPRPAPHLQILRMSENSLRVAHSHAHTAQKITGFVPVVPGEDARRPS